MDCTCQASLSFTISQSLLKFMFIKSMMASNHLILCHHLLLLSPIFPSIRVFSSELAVHIRWLKYWSFSFSIISSNEYSGLNSFRIDWFDLIAVQETPNSSGGKECTCSAGDTRDMGLLSEPGKMPWRKIWQTTPIFLPRKFHGQSQRVGHNRAHGTHQ